MNRQQSPNSMHKAEGGWLEGKRKVALYGGAILFSGLLIWLARPVLWPGGTGIGKGEATIRVEGTDYEEDKASFDITIDEPGRTLWDWLSVLGVPVSLLVIGFFFEQFQERRSEKNDAIQRQRDEKNADRQRQREEEVSGERVLQIYFDRISALLVDKNLLAITYNSDNHFDSEVSELVHNAQHNPTNRQTDPLNVSKTVIRARTLAILRTFSDSRARKAHVIKFLIELGIISQLKVSLNSAELSGTDLSGTDLREADLSKANLSQADLSNADPSGANLSQANLQGADLRRATMSSINLSEAILIGADLTEANLNVANLDGANLKQANLSLTGLKSATFRKAILSNAQLMFAELDFADLTGADLTGADLKNAQLTAVSLSGIKSSSDTQWPQSFTTRQS